MTFTASICVDTSSCCMVFILILRESLTGKSSEFAILEQARPDHIDTMLRESCMMHGMQNAPNINAILAACLRIPAQPLLVYPYADQGNLKKFLQKCKMSEIAASHVGFCGLGLHRIEGGLKYFTLILYDHDSAIFSQSGIHVHVDFRTSRKRPD